MASPLDLLSELKLLPLRRAEDGSLAPIGPVPAALRQRFPALDADDVDYVQVFPLLATFLLDADDLWARGEGPPTRSGPCTQPDAHGRPTVLEATALLVGPDREPFLLIELLGAEFAELQEILQHSRDQRLEYENLTRMHAALSESSRRLERMAAERQSAIDLLREARQQLEQRVAERTVELREANQRLAAESAEREHANRELREHQQELSHLAEQLSAAEERERRQIAEFLHDRIGQNLALVKLRLRAMARNHADAQHELAPVDALMDEIISDTRGLTADLGTPLLYELGLSEALQSLTRRFEEIHGIPARLEDDERDKPLDENARGVLYQAVRELLHNIVKHAEAEQVIVRLRRDGNTLAVEVVDRGRGFDSRDFDFRVTTSGGFGLFNIRERLQHLGGSCTVRSTPGEGTEVSLTVPLA
ncbi:MAG: ATP-binding protein [Planctomycetota bacterium]